MKPETVVTAVSFTCFGVLVGWILGSQQATSSAPAATPAAQTTAASTGNNAAAPPPPLDVQKASDLEKQANAQPSNPAVRVELANLYFDAQRFDLAIPWYEAALRLSPKDADVSTDLGVCYYSTNQVDRALTQFDHSLTIDPKHAKTLLNQGIVRAFGKQDLKGAMESWERVVAVAPGSEEAKRAQQALDDVKAAHGGTAPGTAGAGRGGTN